jgi:hypothetical protein
MLLDLLRQAELCRAQCAEILKGPISLKVGFVGFCCFLWLLVFIGV